MSSCLVTGHWVKFVDPEGEAQELEDTRMQYWKHGDPLRVMSFEIVEGQRLPVCWNERDQSASSVTYESITEPEIH